ncbi:MAG: SIS domain-containing protein [Bacillota bacterium]
MEMWREIQEQPEALVKCIAANQRVISALVEEIRSRNIKTVVIAARGTSDNAGTYGRYIIECGTGIPVSLAAPAVYTVYKRDMRLSDCLVIGISQSGSAEDVAQVIRTAKTCGALTVCITNDEKSMLAQTAGYHLHLNTGVERSVAATKTCTATMYLLANLLADWTADNRLKRELARVPEGIQKVLDNNDRVEEVVSHLLNIRECYVLARGINYPVAMEAALKLQETCYIHAHAFATSDFYHGPYALIQPHTLTMLFAPQGPSFASVAEMLERLTQTGAKTLAATNDRDLARRASLSFIIPSATDDVISAFYNVVFSQMTALRLAVGTGKNPDSPRNLKKVTITC